MCWQVRELQASDVTGWRVVARLALMLGACLLAPVAAVADTVAVDAATRYQTMQGWETHARAFEENKQADAYDPAWQANSPIIVKWMVDEGGVNRIQVPLRSGWINPVDYWSQFAAGTLSYTEWNKHRYEKVRGAIQFSELDFRIETMVLPMAQALAVRGEKLYVNLGVVDFNTQGYLQGTLNLAADPSEYAAFVLACFDRLKTKYGITADALELVNEPENTPWSGAQLGAALVAAKARLQAAGYTGVNYIGPSASSASHTQAYTDAMLSVAGAAQALTTLSYHRYDSPSAATVAGISAYAQGRGFRTDMSEWINATADTLIEDLTVGNVSSFQKWAIAQKTGVGSSPQSFYVLANLSNPGSPQIGFAPNSAFMSQYFRYVRMGAVRVSAQSSASTRVPVAFVNADGRYVVVVKTKAGTGSQVVTLTGLAPGNYGVRTMSYNEQAVDQADVVAAADGSLTITIPDGFTAIHGRGAQEPATVTLVEYRHASWDHYFLTGNPEEIAKVDNGTFAGWQRTGRQFLAYAPASGTGVPVCRFFSVAFAPRSSHFYTPFAGECAIVSGNPAWTLEGLVFNMGLPEGAGNCAAGTDPVYRLYNDGKGGAPNHRYTTDALVRQEMIAAGWIPEGYGALGVTMCAPH